MIEKILKVISDMFKEHNIDKVSHTRVMSAIVIIVPITVWVITVFTKGWVEPGESLALLVGLGFGGKVVQKFAENKSTNIAHTEEDEKIL
jgi:hypothetical protein